MQLLYKYTWRSICECRLAIGWYFYQLYKNLKSSSLIKLSKLTTLSQYKVNELP